MTTALTNRELETLREYKQIYTQEFTISEWLHLRFLRWLYQSGRLAA